MNGLDTSIRSWTGIFRVSAAIAIYCAALLVSINGIAQSRGYPETTSEFEQYLLDNHPRIRAQASLRQAKMDEARSAISAWPQPQISYSMGWGDWQPDSNANRYMVMLSQRIPWPGVLQTFGSVANEEVALIDLQTQKIKIDLLFELRSLLINLAVNHEKTALVQEQLEVNRDVIEIVEQTMAYSDRDMDDLLRLNLAQQMLLDRLSVLTNDNAVQCARLAELLNVDKVPVINYNGLRLLLNKSVEVPEKKEVIQVAVNNSPLLQESLVEQRVADAMIDGSKAQKKPWPTISVGYESMPMGHDERHHIALIGVSIPIPIFNRQYDAAQERFQNARSASWEKYLAARRTLEQQVWSTMAELKTTTQRLERFTSELLPLAGDITERILYELEVGQRTTTDYLISFNQQLDVQIQMLDLQANAATQIAKLRQLMAIDVAEGK